MRKNELDQIASAGPWRHHRTPTCHSTTLLHPTQPHAVWHIDLTEVCVLWRRFETAAVLDGCSRKLLALHVFDHRPTSADMGWLIDQVVQAEGSAPRFVISDHGAQFRQSFRQACKQWGITHIRGKVGVWQINAKIERFFRTLKTWQRRAWMAPKRHSVQRRAEAFRLWYNQHRPHASLRISTPEERHRAIVTAVPVCYRVKGGVDPEIQVRRQSTRGDPRLYMLNIHVRDRPIAA